MSKQTRIEQAAITSFQLTDYKLSKTEKDLLAKFDKMIDFLKGTGRTIPLLRLDLKFFTAINTKVIKQSNGQRKLDDLRYGHYPIAKDIR